MGAIKLYYGGQTGAPQLSGTNGALISLLDAVLVDGFNIVNATSVTQSGNIVTVVCSAAHGFMSGEIAKILGADQSEYNGEWVITAINSTTFAFNIGAATPVTPATGSITCRRAPAGFAKPFNGTNKAAYRSLDTSGSRPYLQVIDAGATTGAAKEAQVRGYLDMTDVDTGADPFPTAAQFADGLFAYKSNAASSAARAWVLISDGKTFYLQTAADQAPALMWASGGYLWNLSFGEINSVRPNEPYGAFIAGVTKTNLQTSSSSGSVINGMFYALSGSYSPSAVTGISLPRSFNQVVGAVGACGIGHGWSQNVLGSLGLMPYPNPAGDNGFYVTPLICAQGGALRGQFPGLYEPLQGRVLGNGDTVENISGLPGRQLLAMWGYNAQSTATTGMLMVDLTGPWS